MSITLSISENEMKNINSNESYTVQDGNDTSHLLISSEMPATDTEINIGMDPKKTGFRSIEILARLVIHVVSNFWKLCTSGVLILLLVLWFYGGLVAFGLFCGGILGLLYHSQDMFLYYPNQPPNSRLFVPSPSSLGLPYESHFVRTCDGIHVNMVLMKQAAPMCSNCPTVIYFHGNAGNIGHRLQDAHGLFTLCGFNVLFVEYRGYGKSEGSPSEGGLYKDAEAAMDFVLRRKDLDQSKLVLTGRSLGGAIAVYLASHTYYARFIFTLILENSFTSLPAIAKELLGLNCIQKLPKLCYKNKVILADTMLYCDIRSFTTHKSEFSRYFATSSTSRAAFVQRWNELRPAKDIEEVSTVENIQKASTTDKPAVIDKVDATIKQKFVAIDEVSTAETIQQASTSDKPAVIDKVDATIKQKFVGYYNILVERLQEPAWHKAVREVDPVHVKELTDEFLKRPYSYYTIMIVNVPDITSAVFKRQQLDDYFLETIGGNHSRIALQNILAQACPETKEMFEKRLVALYAGLTNDEAQRVGTDHNEIHNYGKDITFMDRVKMFRASLFEKGGANESKDIIEKDPPSDTKTIQSWKSALETKTRTANRKQLNNKYRIEMYLAQGNVDLWTSLLKLDHLWKMGMIKGQPENKIKRNVPQLQRHHIMPLTLLDKSNQIFMLNKLCKGEVLLCDFWKKCREPRHFQSVQEIDSDSDLMDKDSDAENEEINKSSEDHIDAVPYISVTALERKYEQAQVRNKELCKEQQRKEDEWNDERKTLKLSIKKWQDKAAALAGCCEELLGLQQELQKVKKDNQALVTENYKLKEVASKRSQTVTEFIAAEERHAKAISPEVQNREAEYVVSTDLMQLDVEDIVAVRPLRPDQYEKGKPWLGVVSKATKQNVFIKWLDGNYNSIWTLNSEFDGAKPDKIQIKLIACLCRWNRQTKMPSGLVAELCKILDG